MQQYTGKYIGEFCKLPLHACNLYVIGYGKRGPLHTTNIVTLKRRNFICEYATMLKFSPMLLQ